MLVQCLLLHYWLNTGLLIEDGALSLRNMNSLDGDFHQSYQQEQGQIIRTDVSII